MVIAALRKSFLLVVIVAVSACDTSALRWKTAQGSVIEPSHQTATPKTHTIQSGETLYSISWRYGLDYKKVAVWNQLGENYTIFPGGKLRLTPNSPSQRKWQPRGSLKLITKHWQWPHNGQIVTNYGVKKHQRSGIDIATKPTDPVRSVADGKVVYSGGGLRNYGLVVIVEHPQEILSMYAYNEGLLVSVGERIKKGQILALAGRSPQGEPRLHFEIRQAGKPMDVLKYLPKR